MLSTIESVKGAEKYLNSKMIGIRGTDRNEFYKYKHLKPHTVFSFDTIVSSYIKDQKNNRAKEGIELAKTIMRLENG